MNVGRKQKRAAELPVSLLSPRQVKKLQAFKGDPDKLTLVDSFMFLLIQVPR